MMKIVVANWKMYPTYADAMVLSGAFQAGLEDLKGVEVIIAPPTAWLLPLTEGWKAKHSHVSFAAQNVWPEDQGAYTGETSVYMLKNVIKYALIGHSERRRYQKEDDDMLREKVLACLKWQVKPILCIGEAKKVIVDGELQEVEWKKLTDQLLEGLGGLNKHQLEDVIIAYEPIWAIGSHNPATAEYTAEVIKRLRKVLAEKYDGAATTVKFLYGGSVGSSNAATYLREDEIAGLLVGGASVKANEFIEICQIASARH